jgi:hypothetical protein
VPAQPPPDAPLPTDLPPDPERPWRPTHLVNFESARIEDSFDRPLVAYDYAWVRLVPRVETGECFNVGVVLFCRTQRFLQARMVLDSARAALLAPHLETEEIARHLALIPALCAGEGPIGALGQAEVFHWLVAPHSTVIQCSDVHSGLCADPGAELERLAGLLPR